MGFRIGRAPDRPARLGRRKVADWLAATSAARCCVLQAGPGSGKTFALALLAEEYGGDGVWLTGESGAGPPLTEWLGLASGADPAEIAAALARAAAARGAPCIVWDAADRLLADKAAMALLRHWIELGDAAAGRTLVATRLPLPFPTARLVVEGRVARLGPGDLWLSPEEVADWLDRLPRHPALESEAAGWPLGVAALRRAAGEPDAGALLRALAAEEWLGPLPADLAARAAALAPLPAVSTAAAARILADGDPDVTLAALADWG
ncbi:MAG: hypothetical protein FJZ01_10875, partial [Candidatus Sericytochromatia bacterium]|nr:hypothetical protein [Candidatus Tanganyikabacteria bacterium]